MASHVCPQKEQLSAYAFGTLDESQAREVAEHVEQCPICDQSLQSLDREGDTLIAQLREPSTADPFLAETGFQKRLPILESLAGDPALLLSGGAVESPFSAEVLPQLREYRLLAKLGEGGMGAVYKALHMRLDKVVAVKVLPGGRLKDPAVVARFEREMKAIGRLEHPNVIRAHDAGEADGVHFLVMEYLDGADLSRVVDHVGPLPVADACELVRQAALGLEYAHQQGLVHRDVKPSNLMLTTDGEVKVLDLGLARLSDQDVPVGAELTSTGQMMGTFDYMAPEQGSDTHKVDIRADIYSLGATLYKLLCGEAPFAGESFNTPMKKMLALATKEPPPLTERRPDAPEGLAALVRQMLAKSPADRLTSPRDVAVALAPFTTGHDLKRLANEARGGAIENRGAAAPLLKTEPYASAAEVDTTPRKSAALETAPRSGRRRRVVAATAAGLACLVLAGVTIYRIQTAEGTIVVKLDDADKADVEAKLKDGGVQIVDLAKQRSYLITPAASKNVPPGKYAARAGAEDLQLRVTDDVGVEMATGEFSLRRGGKLIVHVSLVLTSPAPVQAANDPGQLERNPRDRERRALEWALRNGATLTFTERGTIRTLQVRGPDGKLPGDDYDLRQLTLAPTTTDADLDNIKPIRSLRYLSLSYCSKITDAGLERIRDLTDLDWLDLPGTGISDAGLSALAGMTKLTWVTLDRTQISDKGIDTLSRTVPQLNTLRCVGTHVSSIKPFLPLKKIQILDVPPLRDPQDYARLAEFPELLGFKVAGRGLTDETLRFFPHFPATFRHLSLWDGELDGSGLKELTALPELERLTISGCRLADPSLSHLHGASRLTDLYLFNMPLTDAALEHLSSLKQLRKLDLRGVKITAAGIAQFHEVVPACTVTLDRVLQVAPTPSDSGGESAERRAAGWVLKNGGTLTFVEKSSNRLLQVQGPDGKLPGDDYQLSTILLLSGTTDSDLDNIKPLRSLRNLRLWYCPKITDAGLERIRDMHELDHLDLPGTNITDAGLKALEGMHKLVQVDLSRTRISNEGIEILSRSAPEVNLLRAPETRVTSITPLLLFKKMAVLTVPAFQDPKDYARIAEFPMLGTFDVHGPGLTDEMLEFFPDSPETFTSLMLQSGNLRGPGLEQLAVLPKLTSLTITKCPLADGSLQHLQRASQLAELYLWNVPLTDAALEHLYGLPQLKKLALRNCKITAAGIARFRERVPGCVVTLDGVANGDAERAAVEWALRKGATLSYTEKTSKRTLQVRGPDGELPGNDYELWSVAMPPDTTDADLDTVRNLRSLNTLTLYQCKQITDAGLGRLQNMPGLDQLMLTGTSITDAGLESLSGLSGLRQLFLERTRITKKGIEVLSRSVPGLTVVRTMDTEVTSIEPFLSLPRLQVLDVSAFKDPQDYARLTELPALHSLKVAGRSVTDETLKSFPVVPWLRGLVFQDCDIRGPGLRDLAVLPGLWNLALTGCRLTDENLVHLQGAAQLTDLTLSRMPLTDKGLEQLGELKKLTKLRIYSCNFTPAGIARLQEALPGCAITLDGKLQVSSPASRPAESAAGDPDRRAAEWVVSLGGIATVAITGKVPSADQRVQQVKAITDLPPGSFKVQRVFLSFPRTQTDDAGLANLAGLVELEFLQLSRAGQFTAAGMRHLAELPSLKDIYITQVPLSDDALAPLQNLSKLEGLMLIDVEFSDARLAQLSRLTTLKRLSLRGKGITDASAAAISELKQLVNAGLSNLEITDVGLEQVLKLPMITSLALERVPITDAGVALIHSHPRISSLYLTHMQVTDLSLKALEMSKNLRLLALEETQTTLDGVTALQVALPECRVLWNENIPELKRGSPDRRGAAWAVARGGTAIMSGNGIEEIEIRSFADLPSIESTSKVRKMDLRDTRIRVYDDDLNRLADLSALESLDLRKTRVTSAGVARLQKALPKCKIEWSAPN